MFLQVQASIWSYKQKNKPRHSLHFTCTKPLTLQWKDINTPAKTWKKTIVNNNNSDWMNSAYQNQCNKRKWRKYKKHLIWAKPEAEYNSFLVHTSSGEPYAATNKHEVLRVEMISLKY